MSVLFLVCIFGAIAMIPLHFLSVEHLGLQEKYGKEKGTRIGEAYGLISGWGFFLFWVGIWFSPQPRFTIPFVENLLFQVPFTNFLIPLLHLIVCAPFLVLGPWLAINGVKETTLKVAETHRSEKIISSGVYSIVRHPQYLGGLLTHIGISLLLSAWYSLSSAPLMVTLIFLISKKEEKELIREFRREYEAYKEKVPMFIPRLRTSGSKRETLVNGNLNETERQKETTSLKVSYTFLWQLLVQRRYLGFGEAFTV